MIKIFVSGLLIGIGAIMPGVSGGSLAFVFGVYDKLLEAVGNFLICTREKRKEYFIFLTKIGSGVVLGTLIFTRVIEFFAFYYNEPTNFLFMGLILASLPSLLKENECKKGKNNIFSMLAGIAVMLFFLQFKEKSGNMNLTGVKIFTTFYYLKLVFCGFVSAAALIIPGLSGTVLLLFLGEYYNILAYINAFNIKALFIIGIGFVLGVLIFSKVVDFLFKKYRVTMVNCMIGLVAASVIGIWPGFTKENALINIVCFLLGMGIAYCGEKIGNKK